MLFASYWTVHVTSARPLWTRILWFLFSVYRHHRPSHPGPRLWLTTSSWQLCEVHLSCNDLCACSSILFPWSRQVSVVCAKFAGFFSLVGIFNSVDRCSDCLFFWADPCSSVGLESIFGMLAHAGVCWCKIPPWMSTALCSRLGIYANCTCFLLCGSIT